jgi:glycosyltransferase involved in cell wall biosynthesis
MKTDALAACDIMCNPSAKESFGGAYLEAWALKKPVIGGDAPAVRELIAHGETGYTVGNDSAELANYILHLLNDSGLRDDMGEQGHAVANQFEWEYLTVKLYRVYCELLGGA